MGLFGVKGYSPGNPQWLGCLEDTDECILGDESGEFGVEDVVDEVPIGVFMGSHCLVAWV